MSVQRSTVAPWTTLSRPASASASSAAASASSPRPCAPGSAATASRAPGARGPASASTTPPRSSRCGGCSRCARRASPRRSRRGWPAARPPACDAARRPAPAAGPPPRSSGAPAAPRPRPGARRRWRPRSTRSTRARPTPPSTTSSRPAASTSRCATVVLPLLARIGDRWEAGELSVGPGALRQRAARRTGSGRSAGPSPPVAGRARSWPAPPGERHELGLLCFALLLHDRGWEVTFLGAVTPLEALTETAARVGADLVVLGAAIAGHARRGGAGAGRRRRGRSRLGGRAADARGRGAGAGAAAAGRRRRGRRRALRAARRRLSRRGGRLASIPRMSPVFAHACLRVVGPRGVRALLRRARLRAPRAAELRRTRSTSTSACRATATSLELTVNVGRTEPYDVGDGFNHVAVAVGDLDAALRRAGRAPASSPRSPPTAPAAARTCRASPSSPTRTATASSSSTGERFATPQDSPTVERASPRRPRRCAGTPPSGACRAARGAPPRSRPRPRSAACLGRAQLARAGRRVSRSLGARCASSTSTSTPFVADLDVALALGEAHDRRSRCGRAAARSARACRAAAVVGQDADRARRSCGSRPSRPRR